MVVFGTVRLPETTTSTSWSSYAHITLKLRSYTLYIVCRVARGAYPQTLGLIVGLNHPSLPNSPPPNLISTHFIGSFVFLTTIKPANISFFV